MDNFKTFVFGKKTQLERWICDLNLKSSDFIHAATAFGVGFLCGIFVRRCFKYIILIGISLVILLAILQSCALITFNIATIQKVTGLQDVTNLSSLFFVMTQETKKHAFELSSSGIGFIVGLKIG